MQCGLPKSKSGSVQEPPCKLDLLTILVQPNGPVVDGVVRGGLRRAGRIVGHQDPRVPPAGLDKARGAVSPAAADAGREVVGPAPGGAAGVAVGGRAIAVGEVAEVVPVELVVTGPREVQEVRPDLASRGPCPLSPSARAARWRRSPRPSCGGAPRGRSPPASRARASGTCRSTWPAEAPCPR